MYLRINRCVVVTTLLLATGASRLPGASIPPFRRKLPCSSI